MSRTIPYSLRLNGSTLLQGEADEATYRAMIDGFMDAGFTIEGLSPDEFRQEVTAMEAADVLAARPATP